MGADMTDDPNSYNIDEAYAAEVFLTAHGAEDRARLAELLRGFADGGFLNGLERSQAIFRATTSAGSCEMRSRGASCECFLCRVDREIEAF